jgi:hypothetical protein
MQWALLSLMVASGRWHASGASRDPEQRPCRASASSCAFSKLVGILTCTMQSEHDHNVEKR